MHYEFTPASLRALSAARQLSPAEAADRWSSPELLLGLAMQAECRAASMLLERGIDLAAIRRRWPELAAAQEERTEVNGHGDYPPPAFSHEVRAVLRQIASRGAKPNFLVVATEHLLLGLLAVPGEVTEWLTGHGFTSAALEAEVLRWHAPGEAPVDWHNTDLGPAIDFPADDAVQPVITRRADTIPIPTASESGTVRTCRVDQPTAVFRVLDAAANRAREGLRVVEDYARFVLDDRHLTELLKQLRHNLAAALSQVAGAEFLVARDTLADVGTELSTAAELSRVSPADVASANFKRVQESLRSLEEFGKLQDGSLGAAMKQLRYRVYTLERAVQTTASSLERLAHARLYVLLDGRPTADDFRALAQLLVTSKVDVIQLREKRLDDRELLARARILREVTHTTQTLFVMNDRPDLAQLSGADGVHVGQEELSVKDAKAIVGPAALVGVSTHSLEQARQAVLDGADYIGVGPTFPSSTKAFAQFTGVELLSAVAREIRLPAFAIGGISAENLPQVLAAGFSRVALSGAVCGAADLAAAVRAIRAHLNNLGVRVQ